MQQLFERKNTWLSPRCNTPVDTPLVHSSVTLSLNSSVVDGAVRQSNKTSDNTPEEALTSRAQEGQNLRVSVIYVLNMRGDPLMPTTPRKAKHLLKKGHAHVIKRTPFTIQLNIPTGETVQSTLLGVDTGSSIVGLSVTSDKKELYSDETELRNDIVKLRSERRAYRRARRNRKTWYRQPRFLNRKKPQGWLPPSVQHKLDSHVKLVQNVSRLLPVTQVELEIADFDIQRILNPDIEGKEYQEGPQLGFANVRAYVLFRDHYTCCYCRGRSKEKRLHVHHTVSRQVAGDSPQYLVTLCLKCHKDYHAGKISLDGVKGRTFKAETFMTIVKARLQATLEGLGFKVSVTYGYETKHRREQLGLAKSHRNDAFVIAQGDKQVRCTEYVSKFVRKQNRKLYKGSRSHIRNTAQRYVKGFRLFDKVSLKYIECFIFGRRSSGSFDIRKLDREVISYGVSCKKLKLLESSRTLLIERRRRHSSMGVKTP